MTKKASILITGGAGFTGQHACEHFQQLGWDVTAVVRNTPIGREGVQTISCDLTDKDAVNLLLKQKGPEYVLHLAGLNSVPLSWENPMETMEANLLATLNLLDAVRTSCSASKVVLVGSALQYNPQNGEKPYHPYALSKTMQAELTRHWADLFNLNIVFAKPTNLIGPGPSTGICSLLAKHIVQMERKKKSDTFLVTNLSAKRDFLDVRDAVRAYEKLFLFGERDTTYNIATGNSKSIREVVTELQLLTNMNTFVTESESGDAEFPKNTCVTAIRQLGWDPVYSMAQSLKDTLEHFRQTSNNN